LQPFENKKANLINVKKKISIIKIKSFFVPPPPCRPTGHLPKSYGLTACRSVDKPVGKNRTAIFGVKNGGQKKVPYYNIGV
jgi:hypothetical protein